MDGTLTPNSWATSFTNDNVGFFFVSFLSQLRMTMLTIPSCRDGRDIPRIGSAKCYGPIWNESNGSFWRKVYRGLCRAVNARTRRRQPAVRTATTPRSVKRRHSWQMVGQEVFINRTWFLNFYSRASRPGDQADTLRPRLKRRSRFRYGRYDLPPASLSNVVAVAGPRYR